MSTNIQWRGIRLDPLDTLFFRDGRPFDAATRASGGLPTPQTFAGAIRTALLARTGFRFDEFAKRRKAAHHDIRAALAECGASAAVVDASFRGPWLALASAAGVEPLFPMPEVLKRAKAAGWSRAAPLTSIPLPGWRDPDGLLPLWRSTEADPKAKPELVTLAGLKRFLEGKTPEDDQCATGDALYGSDHRVGIEIHKDSLTSAEGKLYAIRLLALRPKLKPRPAPESSPVYEVCLYAEAALDDELANLLDGTTAPFGGEGKYVRVSAAPACLPRPTATSGRALWYLATPTFFAPTARPLPRGIGLKAAASGSGFAVSGWDVARNGPRPTRFATPAGAVYFVEGDCQPTAFVDAGVETAALQQEGWGFALNGKWEG